MTVHIHSFNLSLEFGPSIFGPYNTIDFWTVKYDRSLAKVYGPKIGDPNFRLRLNECGRS